MVRKKYDVILEMLKKESNPGLLDEALFHINQRCRADSFIDRLRDPKFMEPSLTPAPKVVDPDADPNCILIHELCGTRSVFRIRVRIHTGKNRINYSEKV